MANVAIEQHVAVFACRRRQTALLRATVIAQVEVFGSSRTIIVEVSCHRELLEPQSIFLVPLAFYLFHVSGFLLSVHLDLFVPAPLVDLV